MAKIIDNPLPYHTFANDIQCRYLDMHAVYGANQAPTNLPRSEPDIKFVQSVGKNDIFSHWITETAEKPPLRFTLLVFDRSLK